MWKTLLIASLLTFSACDDEGPCDELQSLSDRCCDSGFPAACGQVSSDFSDDRCEESLDRLRGACANFSCA